ncbi:PAS domain-containing protein [Uliginosibacterium sp. H3]|uniref:PAS domain-containing protein n=1 Tax=Uliginosibacterium silvisoli TaxID=3114758 RepID=A0ABU6K673_9RHOO|nr:PAS domain-containing protein [Uliginosibacterium sp. H3]
MQRTAPQEMHLPPSRLSRWVTPVCLVAIVINAALGGTFFGTTGAGIATASSVLMSLLLIFVSRLQQAESSIERKQAASALAATRAYFVRVLDAIPATIFMKDANSHYTFVNEAFCELRAMSREEILAAPISKMRDERGHATESETEDKQVFSGRSILKEERVFHPDSGQEIFRTVSKRLCHDEHGQALIVGSTQNVSMWRQAEREAQTQGNKHLRQNHFLSFVLNTIPIPVYVKDEELYYLMVNEAFAELMGLPAEQIIGRRANELTDNDVILGDEMHEMSMLAQMDSPQMAEPCWLIDALGNARALMSRKTAGRNAEGNRVLIGTYTDRPAQADPARPRDTANLPRAGLLNGAPVNSGRARASPS